MILGSSQSKRIRRGFSRRKEKANVRARKWPSRRNETFAAAERVRHLLICFEFFAVFFLIFVVASFDRL